jgi:2-polyprenyl-3-methyl-5-hydroxy-6-metoxy-1,4-benzoquinol methylase
MGLEGAALTTTASSGGVVADAQGNQFRLRAIDCPTCKRRDLRLLGTRGGAGDRNRGVETDVVQCRECSLVFPDPFPTPVNGSALYGDPDKYFGNQDAAARAAAVASFRSFVIDKILARSNARSLLDVGSGRCELIEAARQAGITDVVGLEFADEMVAYARESLGIALIPEVIEKYASHVDRTFDAVTLSAVLEHVYDPDAMIAAVRKLTHPGSIVYIDVPNEPNLVTRAYAVANRMIGRRRSANLAPTWAPFHVFGFNEKSLRTLLNKHGFDVDSVWIYSEMSNISLGTSWKARVLQLAVRPVAKIANVTGTAANMYVWARRR